MGRIHKPEKYDAGLTLAIQTAGGITALADALGIGPSAITQWRRVPAERAHAVADFTKVPVETLRPDLWQRVAA